MAESGHASESEGSLADTFDMIDHDDLSEISNDDHDTASITSNEHEHEAQLTPDVAESDEEEEEEGEDELEEVSTINARSHSPSDSVVMVDMSTTAKQLKQVKAENRLIDSYMSEDLDTPRQSVMRYSPTTTINRAQEPKISFEVDQNPSHILFVSSRDTLQSEMDLIVSRITGAMRTPASDTTAIINHKMIRLHPTPTGISPASATVVCGRDRISATVQHCIEAEQHDSGIYGLRILDHDGSHSSWFTVGPQGKTELHKPDLAIFHIPNRTDELALTPALNVIDSMEVPAFIIVGETVSTDGEFRRPACSRFTMCSDDFFNCFAKDRLRLTHAVGELLAMNRIKSEDGKPAKAKRSMFIPPAVNVAKILFTALPALLLLCSMIFSTSSQIIDIPARREALSTSLQKVTSIQNSTSVVDVEHLLPALPTTCYEKTWFGRRRVLNTAECKVDSRYQALEPNHMVLSLPVNSAHLQVVSTKVFKADGRNVSFSTTQLIQGVSIITFDANEAYDTVVINTITEKPAYNITASHYYGKRYFQLKTYEKAGNEVGKMVGSDLAIMSKTVRKINNLLSNEVSVSVQASRNATCQLAKYVGHELQTVSREIQVFGKTANAMLNKAGRANEELAKGLVKDLVVVQKDLVRFTRDLSVSVKSRVEAAKSNTKALIQSPLALSRQRVQNLKQAFRRQEKGQHAKAAAKLPIKDRATAAQKTQQSVKRQLHLKNEQKAKVEARLQASKQHREEHVAMEQRKANNMPSDTVPGPAANQYR